MLYNIHEEKPQIYNKKEKNYDKIKSNKRK